MTNEEAIEILEANRPDPCYQMLREAVDFAVNALKAQGTCKDAVSRQTLQKELALYPIDDITSEDEAGYNRAINDIQKMVLHLPSAQPEKAQLSGENATFDCISRQVAIDAILAVTGNSSVRELYEHVQEHGLSDMWSGGVNAAIDIIIAVPSAQPDSKELSFTQKKLDTISRQAVLDALQKHFNPTGAELSPDLASVLAGVGVVINTMPSSPSRPSWIPCSERLPEKDGDYLTTLTDKDGNYVDVTEWQNIIGGRWIAPLDECDYCEIGNVVAWMPLPEPYRAERRNDVDANT